MEYTFEQLKKKINKAEIRIKKDKELLHKLCPHKNLEWEQGYTDYQGYDRDYVYGCAKCPDCGLYVSERDSELFEIMRKIYFKNHYEKFHK